MSRPIDFNMLVVGDDAHARSHLTTGQKERLLPRAYEVPKLNPYAIDYKYARAFQNKIEEELVKDTVANQLHASSLKTIDKWSWKISLALLLGSLGAFVFSSDWRNNKAVRLTQDVLLITNDGNLMNASRLFRAVHDRHFSKNNNPEYTIVLQKSHWITSDHVVMPYSVEAKIGILGPLLHLWPLLFWIYIWSLICQWHRAHSLEGLYKPWKGPDFGRWLEYLLTSPLQIVVVSMSFQFVTVDTLFGLFGMQAALVLLGYSIEQQIKKVYKRRVLRAAVSPDFEAPSPSRMHHLLWNWGVKDVRLLVYLVVTWLLHVFIWGLPRLCPWNGFCPWLPWGIGGLYQRLKDMNAYEHGKDLKVPAFVEAIFWGQFLCFTAFGIACTAQAVAALRLQALPAEGMVQYAAMQWIKYSRVYSILSITAKALLQICILGYVGMWKTWDLYPKDVIVSGNMTSGLACAAATRA